jgi:hypothetical protein
VIFHLANGWGLREVQRSSLQGFWDSKTPAETRAHWPVDTDLHDELWNLRINSDVGIMPISAFFT